MQSGLDEISLTSVFFHDVSLLHAAVSGMHGFACQTVRRRCKNRNKLPVSGTVGFGRMFETVLILNEPADCIAVIGFVGEQRIGRFAFAVGDIAAGQEETKPPAFRDG
jgi:hypothetical protein